MLLYCKADHIIIPIIPYHTEEKEEYDVTGSKTYTKSCEALGIIPATYFVRTVQAKEHNICMSHHGVGPKGAKAISVALTVRVMVVEGLGVLSYLCSNSLVCRIIPV